MMWTSRPVHTPGSHTRPRFQHCPHGAPAGLLAGMTADTQAARAGAQFREALADLTRFACTSPDAAGGVGAWAELARDLAGRYYVHLDGLDGRRGLRYVAIARNLAVRPYAVITSDPQELRDVVGPGEPALGPCPGQGQVPP
jgi:hypothetical protein